MTPDEAWAALFEDMQRWPAPLATVRRHAPFIEDAIRIEAFAVGEKKLAARLAEAATAVGLRMELDWWLEVVREYAKRSGS